jgi:hypothetical protein
VIDNRPLQEAAWADLNRARKRLEKATRDVHRHEEIDEPAFRAWLAAAFPTLISAARDLAQQLAAKLRLVQEVEHESYMTGRSPGQIWRKWQRSGAKPPASPLDADENDVDSGQAEPSPDFETAGEDEMKRRFAEDDDPDDPFADLFREMAGDLFGLRGGRETPPASSDARATYRRLVQHLHPDRGGEWTPSRARLWEQVQAAWAARDADWLARLEAEWEAGTDLLGPTSAIGRLRAALAEIDAARRDAEKRVREYRKQRAWRFSLKPPSLALRLELERQLKQDQAMFRAQLEEVEGVMEAWSKPAARRHSRGRRRRAPEWDFGF